MKEYILWLIPVIACFSGILFVLMSNNYIIAGIINGVIWGVGIFIFRILLDKWRPL